MSTPIVRALAAALLLSAMVLIGPACVGNDSAEPDAVVDIPCSPDNDRDGDGYGPGCPMGEDCDDNAPGITGPCRDDGCPEGFVLISAGPFLRGCDEGEGCNIWTVQPQHTVEMSAYCIESTEVSVAAYRMCKDGDQCSFVGTNTLTYAQCNFTQTTGARGHHPINCISWESASEYCRTWLGGELPTEAQWEKAARGDDGRIYPWGNGPAPDCSRVNLDVNGVWEIVENTGYGFGCDSIHDGLFTWEVEIPTSNNADSPYGLRHMAGNVGEWTYDCGFGGDYADCGPDCKDPIIDCGDGERWYTFRGGNALQTWRANFFAYSRHIMEADDGLFGSDGIGFRCVRTTSN